MIELRRVDDPAVHVYLARDARFDLGGARFDAGVELEHSDESEDEVPRKISIRLASLEWTGAPATLAADGPQVFGQADSTQPRAFVYSGFHHARVRVRFRVVALDGGDLTADLHVDTDDVMRYDEAATRTIITGPLTLRRGQRDSFWHP